MDTSSIQFTMQLWQFIVGLLVFVGTLCVAWGTLKSDVKNLGKNFGVAGEEYKELRKDIKDVRERFSVVEDRVDTMWKDGLAPALSPRQLNNRGESILNESGIKEIIEKKRTILLELVKTKNINNPYDAENAILQVASQIPEHCPDIIDELKNGAFRVGANLDDVLFVGGIYLRNLIFKDLGFSLEDLDKPKKG